MISYQFDLMKLNKPLFILTVFFLCQPEFSITCRAQTGVVNIETWTNIPGTSISSIPVNSTPNFTGTLTKLETPQDVGDNYGRRIRGYIHPPTSGNYIFGIASNNKSELWLSTSSQPQNKVKIASVTDWTNYRQWTKYTSQKSVSLYLVAGQKYYIEVLHKESTLGDHVSVGWQLPNGTLERPVPGSRLSPFTTTPSQGTIFAVISDYGSNSSNEAAVANLVKSWQPQFILTCGDNNYPDGSSSTIDANVGKYYHSYIKPYTGSYGGGALVNSFFPTLGNHDVITSNGAPYLQYFTLPGNERYYDFVRGDIHFFAINSNPSEPDGTSSTSAQGTWLKNNLSASTSKWNIVYFHHSPFSSDNVNGNQAWMQWPYKTWGADVVISGHSHVYERIIRDNFPYVVNGLGGSSIYSFKTSPVPGSVIRYNQKYGALKVTVTSNSLTIKFYNTSYSVIDSYTLVKQGSKNSKVETLPLPEITVVGHEVKVIKNGSIAASKSVIIVEPVKQKVDTIGSINKNTEACIFKVYPNPNNGVFTIALNMPIQRDSKIKVIVMDGAGEKVYKNEFVSVDEFTVQTIELNRSLPSGIYHMQIILGSKVEKTHLMLLR